MGINNRLLRPKASGFNPRSISGLFAWYDASVSSSITIQTGVQQWSDLSGNGYHLTQNTTNNQPQHGTVTQNGRPVVTFDGTNDFLRTAAFTLNQPYHTFIVFRYETVYASTTLVCAHNIGSPRSGELSYSAATTTTSFSGGSLFRTGIPAGAREAFNGYDLEANGASSALRYRASAVTGNGGSSASNGLTVGANGNSTAALHADCSVAELIIFSRAVSAADATRIRNYLSGKWGISYA